MDKKLWNTIGLIILISNALGILVLFETLVFKLPFISLFIGIFYGTWRMNERMFRKNIIIK